MRQSVAVRRSVIGLITLTLLSGLCGCGEEAASAQTPIDLRTSLNDAGGCGFTLALRADYGDYVKDFTLACTYTDEGAAFTVESPEEVQGITAAVSGETADVSYDETVLAVEDVEDRALSPLAAPYLLGQAWAKGYLSATGTDGNWETAEYTLGYGSEQLTVYTAFSGGIPVYAEISTGEAVPITCEISEFQLGAG